MQSPNRICWSTRPSRLGMKNDTENFEIFENLRDLIDRAPAVFPGIHAMLHALGAA